VKAKIRKALNSSGKQKCDICENNEILEIHHINGRDIENAEAQYNLANICPNCHNKVHWGKIIIEKWITGTKGLELLWHFKNDMPFEEVSKPYIIGGGKKYA